MAADEPSSRAPTERGGVRRRVVSAWAVTGVAIMLLEAVLRLGERAVRTIEAGLDGVQTATLVVVVAAFAYGEGYRALQRRFAPAVVERALEAGRRHASLAHDLAAPLYALRLFGAPQREVRVAWLGVALIVVAIVIVRALPDPWRGIVDAGVAVALAWGTLALVVSFARAWRREQSRP